MKKTKIPLIAIVVGIILIIGGLVFVLKYSDKESLVGKKVKFSEQDLRDSDNDGLKDWEEELFKTNPNNPDTDNDGYIDGEEVNSGHNPLVKAPGDMLGFYPLPLGDKYNITKKVLDEETVDSIVDSYIFQKSQYVNDHPEINSPETFSALTKTSTIQEMIQRALADAYPLIIEKAQDTISEIPEIFQINISDEDINISEDNSKEAIKLYLSQVSSILNSDTFFLKEQSLRALEAAFKDGDFSKLDQLIKLNDEKIEIAKEITVPSSWKEIHKQGLRLTILIRNIFVSLRDVESDPLKTYAALDELDAFPDQWNELMKQAIDLAKSQGIELSL